eukprot:CAMPEP_0202918996 /NCGR_PEP_ID=MMETSP1392-20130828/74730_1 /ASSEMBLY_ACC=CAM_ASM_000868 /TAXON_ID=225041 /ORGANISM="Chlamydomonas chlamydogama, Strain SAG 11-48b" /LENGTH=30 /DNA_ID= /DNA_START= /DNA_END= /DNA_ORIENTATION=
MYTTTRYAPGSACSTKCQGMQGAFHVSMWG